MLPKTRQGFFNAALTDEVIVSNKDGNRYKILPLKNESRERKSPFEDILLKIFVSMSKNHT
jgi:hypothetical protein